MSDSGSSIGEARMLERRISNNRADLSSDQQMNYFLSWFNSWSDLQKSDFVPVLASKMSGTVVNGLAEKLDSLELGTGGRPPSLFACQIKLFREWFGSWSDDQKNYLVLRLQDIDPEFYENYEEYLQNPEKDSKPKDFFEPGVPKDLIQRASLNEKEEDSNGPTNGSAGDNGPCDQDDSSLKKSSSPISSAALSPISE